MKKWKIAILELPMLLGIVFAALVLPGNTPFLIFLVMSGLVFIAGNYFIIVRPIRERPRNGAPTESARTSFARDLGICAICWLLYYLIAKL
jgi:hypothetical protein